MTAADTCVLAGPLRAPSCTGLAKFCPAKGPPLTRRQGQGIGRDFALLAQRASLIWWGSVCVKCTHSRSYQPSNSLHTRTHAHTHSHTHNGRPEYRRKRGRKQLALISIAVVFANTQAVSTRWRGFFQTFCATCRGWIVFLRPATSAGACLSVDIHMYICIYVYMYICIYPYIYRYICEYIHTYIHRPMCLYVRASVWK